MSPRKQKRIDELQAELAQLEAEEAAMEERENREKQTVSAARKHDLGRRLRNVRAQLAKEAGQS